MTAIIKFFTLCFLSLYFLPSAVQAQSTQTNREAWLTYVDKVARPVLKNLANDKLKETMPVTLSPQIDNPEHRTQCAYLEAFGRTLCGIAPWLETNGGTTKEIALRQQYREWTLQAIANAVDSTKNDYLLWKGGQPLVDASFFALGLVRSPWLWDNLDDHVRANVVDALRQSQDIIPVYSNWILFSSMIEAFFCKYGYDYDRLRIEYGVREFSQHWYAGDGMYADGMHFAMDYYNSYVIQPYLMDILDAVQDRDQAFEWFRKDMLKIAGRYAQIQERCINSDGSYPAFGRSIVYRGGAFQHLANMALKKRLPDSLSPQQVRCALTAVLHKTLEAPNTFTNDGWLNIGLCGHQPELADFYINTGSLYLCSAIFLPLGLPIDDPFWTNADEPWSAQKIWNGMDAQADHSIH